MLRGDLFLRAALVALDEAGDPTGARGIVEAARKKAAPLRAIARPAHPTKRIGWFATQLAMVADDPARAYMRLRELCAELFTPLATQARPAAPAPEVALTLSPTALVDAIAPPPRVLARELAIAAELDAAVLMTAPRADRRVLGVRAIPGPQLGRHAAALAAAIATDPSADVRAEALALATRAGDPARAKLATALLVLVDAAAADVRTTALAALRALKPPPAAWPEVDTRVFARLADPAPSVRAAAARLVQPASSTAVGEAVAARLADADPDVRTAALDAVARTPTLHQPWLVQPLCALVQLHRGDTRNAIYLLGKLHAAAAADDATLLATTLVDALSSARSDVARVAAIVLQQLGIAAPEAPVETRLLRAARELAAPDRETQLAGLFEAQRLGEAARSLVPAMRRLGGVLAAGDDNPEARATLAQVHDALTALGVPAGELPRASSLAPVRGVAPTERAVHGAYVIAALDDSALGVWDHATGTPLFAVAGAKLLEILPGRPEVGVLRVVHDRWSFERYAVPTGKRIATLAIPDALTHGWPTSLAAAADLVTIWCGHAHEPYRFHIKLGASRDRLLDDAPSAGRKRERGRTKRPRSR